VVPKSVIDGGLMNKIPFLLFPSASFLVTQQVEVKGAKLDIPMHTNKIKIIES